MKKLLVFFVILAMLFVSCKNDSSDDSGSPMQPNAAFEAANNSEVWTEVTSKPTDVSSLSGTWKVLGTEDGSYAYDKIYTYLGIITGTATVNSSSVSLTAKEVISDSDIGNMAKMYSAIARTTITPAAAWAMMRQLNTNSNLTYSFGSPYTINMKESSTLDDFFASTSTYKIYKGSKGSYKTVSKSSQTASGISINANTTINNNLTPCQNQKTKT